MTDGLTGPIRETIEFLRKATTGLRQIADGSEPEIARQLRRVADQCEVEANELAMRFRSGSTVEN
jgi:hypothetical protein